MNKLNSKSRGLTLTLVVAGALGVAGTADAVIYKGKWDPAFGLELPDLGWKGEADFEIKDDCLATVHTDGWVANSGDCAGKVVIKNATVTLYDLNTDGVGPAAPDVTLNYTNVQLASTLRIFVDWVSETDKRAIAVEGYYSQALYTDAPFAKLASADIAGYFLSFNGNPLNTYGGPVNGSAPLAPDKAYVFMKSCSYSDGQPEPSCFNNDPNKPVVMTIVPEPEGYLLGLASLGVLGVWARRHRPVAT